MKQTQNKYLLPPAGSDVNVNILIYITYIVKIRV